MINKNKLGEHIVIDLLVHPNQLIMYKDSKLIKSNNIDKKNLNKVFESLSIDDIHSEFILKNIDSINQILIDSNGIEKYSLI